MAQKRDIIVIGASAGGVGALKDLVRNLLPDIPAAIFVVLHMPPNHRSHLASILSRIGPLPALSAEDGQAIEHGRILVAPPDFHLLVSPDIVHVARGPRVNRSRPAIDLLFQSASAAYESRVIGVVLSGLLDDGTRGLATIKRRGGYALVQDPDEASFDGMPRNAIEGVQVDCILPVSQIGDMLNHLVTERLEGEAPVSERVPQTVLAASSESGYGQQEISPFTCPECSGTLWEIEEGSLVHYQCRVGHSFTPSNLIAAQVDEVEALLWSALRAMEEREAIYRMIIGHSRETGIDTRGTSIAAKLEVNQRHAAMLHEILIGEESSSVATSSAAADSD